MSGSFIPRSNRFNNKKKNNCFFYRNESAKDNRDFNMIYMKNPYMTI